MEFLMTSPSQHYDKGIGVMGWHFYSAVQKLKVGNHGVNSDGEIPVFYLQRHAIELFLKSAIFILHKKFDIEFSDGFSLSRPAIKIRGSWKSLDSTHNLSDLYEYFEELFNNSKTLLPAGIPDELPRDLKSKINLISGYDPKSTFFRYPESGCNHTDKRKSKIHELESSLVEGVISASKPAKLFLMVDEQGEVVKGYDLNVDHLSNIRGALDDVSDLLSGVHMAFRTILTDGQ